MDEAGIVDAEPLKLPQLGLIANQQIDLLAG
jgi:hypothetical protein